MLLFTNPEELAKAKGAVDRVVRRAIALDGTCQSLSLHLIAPHVLTDFQVLASMVSVSERSSISLRNSVKGLLI